MHKLPQLELPMVEPLEFLHGGWLQVTTAGNQPLVTQLETVLDRGEAEAIALAVERSLDELRQH